MRKIYLSIFILSFTAAIFSCEYDKEEAEIIVDDEIAYCDTATVTYNNMVKNIIDNNCATIGCHNAAWVGKDFSTYAGVKQIVDNGTFKKRVFDGNPSFMPAPSGITNDADLEKLKCWIAQGAKEN